MIKKIKNMTDAEDEKFDEDKFYKDIESYMKSKGAQKMWNYFLDITKKEYFDETIKDLRKKYDIPAQGFPLQNGHRYIPSEGFAKQNELRDEIVEKICKKYKLHLFDFSDILMDFVYI